jgi:hypothetical protein
MPAVIDSAPDCVLKEAGTEATRVDDSADFILQANYEGCADVGGGFMTFGPGSTYGAEGVGADTAYVVLTWIGIAFIVLALLAWVVLENRRFIAYHAAKIGGRLPRGETADRWKEG